MRRTVTLALALIMLLVSLARGGTGSAAQGGGDEQTSMEGAVYTMTNGPMRNEVIAYGRAANGELSKPRRYATGGKGSGAFENSDTMLVLGSSEGQSSPVQLGGGEDLLFALNAGSDSVSVFKVTKGGLDLVEVQQTGGERPISLTVRNGLLYVLNSAGDGVPGAGFCYGGMPEIAGFRVAASGKLAPISGSNKRLSGGVGSGCAQVTFNPRGDVLLVSQIGSDTIDTFRVGSDGVARGPIVNKTSGVGPFALAFDKRGRLLTTENFGAAERKGAVASYAVGRNGRLAPIRGSIPIGETDPCWFVVSPDGEYAYTSNFGPSPILTVKSGASRRGTISSYRIRADGSLRLLRPQAAQVGVGAVDIARDRQGRYLYALNTVEGSIEGYRVGMDGRLTSFTRVGGIPHKPSGQSGGLAAR